METASSLVQALEQQGLGSCLLVEVLIMVHHSLHSSLTTPQGASPLSHHCPTAARDLLGEQTRGLPGVSAAATRVSSPMALVAAVGLSRLVQGLSNTKCTFGRTQPWMSPQHKP